MTPTKAIEHTDDMMGKLTALVAHLHNEADEVAEQWYGLGQAGGQREDHAASLLTRLRPHLEAIESFAHICGQQITGYVKDPFGRQAAMEAPTV